VLTALSDEELVAKYQEHGGPPRGTPFADELFQRHYSRVALWCYRVAGDRDAATDLAQEVFTKAWSHLSHFRADSKFSTWLYMIARNHCFNALRSRERQSEDAVEPGVLDALGVQAAGFDSALERAQLTGVAREMMAKELTPVEAQVMMLHFGEDMPLATISRLLKMENASGAKAYVVSAKRKLKVAVDRWTARMQRSPQDGRSSHE
jgi:RNA polymerase sigma-70 factor (ECF subfamily)